MVNEQKKLRLNNGIEMPVLGFGTYLIPDGEPVISSVAKALEIGYRHIDTAAIYKNEEGVGEGLRRSGISRNQVFLTSKVWNSDQGYESTLQAFNDSLRRLGTDYLDLYLIHWPKNLNSETWRAMEKLYKDGSIKSIGVSNFQVHHLEDLMISCEIRPMVNQVEFHPDLSQAVLLEFCRNKQIQLEAWSPLMQGRINEVPLLQTLAEKYGKTPAQLVLRWDIQQQVVTLPKSVTESRMRENFDIFDFELSDEDMSKVSALNKNKRIGPDPDHVNF